MFAALRRNYRARIGQHDSARTGAQIRSGKPIEILGLEGESTNEKRTILLGYKVHNGVNISSQTRLFTTEKIFCNSLKQVSLVSSADVNTIIFGWL
jgi:hypothetical protein